MQRLLLKSSRTSGGVGVCGTHFQHLHKWGRRSGLNGVQKKGSGGEKAPKGDESCNRDGERRDGGGLRPVTRDGAPSLL